jgi:hypothetical protein
MSSPQTVSLRYQGQVSGRAVEVAEALSALATRPTLATLADERGASDRLARSSRERMRSPHARHEQQPHQREGQVVGEAL